MPKFLQTEISSEVLFAGLAIFFVFAIFGYFVTQALLS